MKAFIKKHEYNFIKNRINDYRITLKLSLDPNIIKVNKAIINEEILSLFTSLTDEEEKVLDLSNITELTQTGPYMDLIQSLTYGIDIIENSQIKKLFRKEKKLKLPKGISQEDKLAYLGWLDQGSKKLYIVYPGDYALLGMVCRIEHNPNGSMQVCKLCNHVGNQDEVSFVSPVCKSSKTFNYRSIGFGLCLDSAACNSRITSLDKLESILHNVNS